MDTPINDIPFKVIFVKNFYNNNNQLVNRIKHELTEYSFDENKIGLDNINLEEFIDIEVELLPNNINDTPNDASFYMEGLDNLENLPVDELENPYIPPNKRYPLFIQRGKDRGYPWIPGEYIIQVNWDKKKYYSKVKVHPKHLSEDELELMRKDLEEQAIGLARDIIRKKRGIDFVIGNEMYVNQIDQFLLISQSFNKIKSNLSAIINNPLYDITKNYHVLALHKVRKIDNRSYKWLQSYKGIYNNSGLIYKPTVILTPKSEVTYDIPVNRWIKFIIKYFIDILNNVDQCLWELKKYYLEELKQLVEYNKNNKNLGYLNIYKTRKNALSKVEKFQNEAYLIKRKLTYFSNSLLLKQTSFPHDEKIPMILTRESRYRYIYQTYRKLKSNIETKIQDLYDYEWKSSDVLYEYWCYVQIIKYCIDYNYQPISGWIFDNKSVEPIFIPSIPDGTTVEMLGENSRIKIVFNSPIPRDRKLAYENGEPYWSRSMKNKPDIRIDVYNINSDEFLFSIILDAKYRKARYIWDSQMAKRNYGTSHTIFQLKEYANKFVETDYRNENPRHIVKRVVALCPTELINKRLIDNYDDHLISIVQLKPGLSNEDFKKELLSYLEFNRTLQKG